MRVYTTMLRAFGLVVMLVGMVPAQDLAAAVAKAQELLATAKTAERADAVRLVGEALDGLERVAGADENGDVATTRWSLGLEAGRAIGRTSCLPDRPGAEGRMFLPLADAVKPVTRA